MAGFTPVTSMQRLTLPDPIGVDQLKRRNALAERDQVNQDQNALNYQRQIDAQIAGQEYNRTQNDLKAQEAQKSQAVREALTLAQYAAQAKAPAEFQHFTRRLGQNPLIAQHLAQQNLTPDQIQPEDIQELIAEFGSQAGIGPAPEPVPFEETPEAAKLRMQNEQAMELERLKAENDARLERLRQSAPATRPAPENKPLPVGALRLQLDAKEALSTTMGVDKSLQDIHRQIATGELKLGPIKNAASATRNATGTANNNSIAYQTMKSSLEKLRNDSLRLNKGVQTEGDAQRAWNELYGSLNDGRAVMAQISRIREINKRAMALQRDNIAAIDQNYGRQTPPESSGWSVEEVQ